MITQLSRSLTVGAIDASPSISAISHRGFTGDRGNPSGEGYYSHGLASGRWSRAPRRPARPAEWQRRHGGRHPQRLLAAPDRGAGARTARHRVGSGRRRQYRVSRRLGENPGSDYTVALKTVDRRAARGQISRVSTIRSRGREESTEVRDLG